VGDLHGPPVTAGRRRLTTVDVAGGVRKDALTIGAVVLRAAAVVTGGFFVAAAGAAFCAVLRFFFLELVVAVAANNPQDSSMATARFAKRRIVEIAHKAPLQWLRWQAR